MSRAPAKVLLRWFGPLTMACALARAGEASPRVEVPADAGALVLRFSDGFGEAAGDPRVVLEMFADGRVVVTRPAFVLGSPRAETRLSSSDVGELLASMAAHGVFTFDATRARAELKAVELQRAEEARAHPGEVELITRTDSDPTTLELHVRDGDHVISWAGLRGDVAAHPEIASLRGLHEAQEELRALMRRKELR